MARAADYDSDELTPEEIQQFDQSDSCLKRDIRGLNRKLKTVSCHYFLSLCCNAPQHKRAHFQQNRVKRGLRVQIEIADLISELLDLEEKSFFLEEEVGDLRRVYQGLVEQRERREQREEEGGR